MCICSFAFSHWHVAVNVRLDVSVDSTWTGDCHKSGPILEICLCTGFITHVSLEVAVVSVTVGCVLSDELARDSRICTTSSIGGRSSGVNETHLQAISKAIASSWCGAVSLKYFSTTSNSWPFSLKQRNHPAILMWCAEKEESVGLRLLRSSSRITP